MGKGKRGDVHAREAARRQRAAARKPAPAGWQSIGGGLDDFDAAWAEAFAAANPGVSAEKFLTKARGEHLVAQERTREASRPARGDARARARRVHLDLERLEARRAVLWERAAVEVAALRAEGVSWREVGSIFGMSDVAALKRFGR